ncbi:MAG: indolepyruvate ferredoxin oxidoreductase subunit alpha [Christensenellales bacterium]|jgi:indolepyruvate ferredoxin oxidoreductase alpha subunit
MEIKVREANKKEIQLRLGNEAIARGAWEAGVKVTASYPGTPSTEITENIARYGEIKSQWAPNEKVAVEVAFGASVAGARALSCMKHVGVNVAADPIFTVSYTGVNGGFVIVVADDPAMFSSQNEQDSRFYARSAHVPMLEPSDSQECLDMMKLAYEISEKYDTPVFVRLTTRIAHARSLTALGERNEMELRPYVKDVRKYVMMPSNAIGRHVVVEKRMDDIARDCNGFDINRAEMRGDVGVITSGASYQYVREAMPQASVLKLGMVYPLPKELIEEFAGNVKTLYVVEELEPFIEDQIKAWQLEGIMISGKDKTGKQGELSVAKIKRLFCGEEAEILPAGENLPVRPPVLCPGCPHRAVFYAINKLKLRCVADIGCYTLGALAPLSAVDTVICMGASIGMSTGMDKAAGHEFSKKTVAVIGDSTFLHSGVTGLIDMVYNESTGTVLILDNSTTGMTGHQEHAATGKTITGEPAPKVDLLQLVKACGVKDVAVVDPFNLKELEAALKSATANEEPSVIIALRPCVLLSKDRNAPVRVENCRNCGICMRIGCPAISRGESGVEIDDALCVGCGLCTRVCPFGCLKEAEQSYA